MSLPENPLFYTQPQALNVAAHGDLSINDKATLAFAKKTNSVPLLVDEFGLACRDYPILFTGGANIIPIAVLGIGSDHNAFVDGNGHWENNTYIPAYVRRYPFIFSNHAESDELTLCIDRNDEWVMKGNQNPLFDSKEQPTAITKQALEFCTRFQQQLLVTKRFCDALVEADLLIEQKAEITLLNGEKTGMAGFQIVDENKLKALPAEKLKQLTEQGWLGLIYAHLIAAGSWARVVTQLSKNPANSKPL